MTTHTLELHFYEDGIVEFFPKTDDPLALAIQLRELVAWLIENPGAIECAAGVPGGRDREGAA